MAERRARLRWALRKRATRVATRMLERGLLETADHVPLERLALAHPERVEYAPSGWRFLSYGLADCNVGPDDVFIDFGSGKGRVLHQAALRYPFGRVVGVEISEELNRIARINIERRRRHLKARVVEVVTCDALDFAIPDDMTVAYFFNPFGGDVFRTVIDQIVASIDRAPRTVTLIYANPVMETDLNATDRFRLVRRRSGRWGWDGIAVYRSLEGLLPPPSPEPTACNAGNLSTPRPFLG